MRLTETEKTILWAAIEDYTGLERLAQELRNLFPRHNEEELRKIAEQAVKSLVAKNFVKLYRRKAVGYPHEPVPEAEYDVLLARKSWWYPSDTETEEISIASTKQGEEIYYSLRSSASSGSDGVQ